METTRLYVHGGTLNGTQGDEIDHNLEEEKE